MLKHIIEDLIHSATQEEFFEPHQYAFRGSSLPYCAVRDAVTQCLKTTDTLPQKRIPFKNQLWMDQGTTIHRLLQKALGLQGKLYGNWKCFKCETKRELLLGPQICCEMPMEYRELRIDDKATGFSGSPDAIINLDGRLLLLDFKTTDKRKIGKSLEINLRHRLQVCGYHYFLVRPPFNLVINDAAIVYIGRDDDLSRVEAVPIPLDEFSQLEFERFSRLKVQADQAMIDGNIASLPGFCRRPNDEPYCPYSGYCFGPSRETNLNSLWEKAKKQ